MAESAASKRGGSTRKRTTSAASKRSGSTAKKGASASSKRTSTATKSKSSAASKRATTTAKKRPAAKSAASKSAGSKSVGVTAAERAEIKGFSRFWWLWLLFGIAWIAISVVILQFDQASITTVGIIIGAMFLGAAVQNFAVAGLTERGGWVFGIFGVLFLAAAVISFISPENTFAAVADILGFLFLLVGVFWIIEAFMAREVNDLWWLGLIGGILMVALAFYTGGQFFVEKTYVLLVFAGIWALMEGVINLVRAFQIRKLGHLV